MAKIFLPICAILLTFGAIAETEPNDIQSQSDTLILGGMDNGSLGGADTADWFTFQMLSDGSLSLDIQPTGMALDLILYNSLLIQVDRVDSLTDSSRLVWPCQGADRYYFLLIPRLGSGTYQIAPNLTSPATSKDPAQHDNPATAIAFAENTSYFGHLGYRETGVNTDFQDWYKLTADSSGAFEFVFKLDTPMRGHLTLYDSNLIARANTPVDTGTLTLNALCHASGVYYVRVWANQGCGGYQLSWRLFPSAYGMDQEPNDAFGAAAPSAFGLIEGHIGHQGLGSPDIYDWHKLALPDDGELDLNIQLEQPLMALVRVYDDQMTQLASTTIDTGSLATQVSCLGADTVWIEVLRFSGCGGYRISPNLVSPPHAGDAENNDLKAQAGSLMLNQADSGHIFYRKNASNFDRHDWYAVPVPGYGDLTVQLVASAGVTTGLHVYDRQSKLLASDSGQSTSAMLSCIGPDTVWVQVSAISGCGSYRIEASGTLGGLGTETEPNHSMALANSFGTDSSMSGVLGSTGLAGFDTADWQQLRMREDGSLQYNWLRDAGLQMNIAVFDSFGVLLQEIVQVDTAGSLDLSCLGGGRYYTRIQHLSGCGGWNLSFARSYAGGSADREANGLIAQADLVAVDSVLHGRLGFVRPGVGHDTLDWYRLRPDSGLLCIQAQFDGTAAGTLMVADTQGNVISQSAIVGFDATLSLPVNGATYLVGLQVTQQCQSYSMYFRAGPQAVVPGLPNSICRGESVLLSHQSLRADSIRWLTPGGSPNTSTDSQVHVTYAAAGSHHITLIAYNCAGSDTSTWASGVVVHDRGPTTISQSGDTLISSPAVSYQWYRNGLMIAGAQNRKYVVPDSAGYQVVVVDTNGCLDTSSTVSAMPSHVPMVEVQAYTIFPNPASQVAVLEFSKPRSGTLQVMALGGRMQAVIPFRAVWSLHIDCGSWPKGMYVCRLQDDVGRPQYLLVQ